MTQYAIFHSKWHLKSLTEEILLLQWILSVLSMCIYVITIIRMKVMRDKKIRLNFIMLLVKLCWFQQKRCLFFSFLWCHHFSWFVKHMLLITETYFPSCFKNYFCSTTTWWYVNISQKSGIFSSRIVCLKRANALMHKNNIIRFENGNILWENVYGEACYTCKHEI